MVLLVVVVVVAVVVLEPVLVNVVPRSTPLRIRTVASHSFVGAGIFNDGEHLRGEAHLVAEVLHSRHAARACAVLEIAAPPDAALGVAEEHAVVVVGGAPETTSDGGALSCGGEGEEKAQQQR